MLNKAVREEVNQRKPSLYSQLRLNTEVWYKHLNKLRIETCSDNRFWLEFWRAKTVTKPTSEDREQLKQLHEEDLNDYQLVLAVSLKYLKFYISVLISYISLDRSPSNSNLGGVR